MERDTLTQHKRADHLRGALEHFAFGANPMTNNDLNTFSNRAYGLRVCVALSFLGIGVCQAEIIGQGAVGTAASPSGSPAVPSATQPATPSAIESARKLLASDKHTEAASILEGFLSAHPGDPSEPEARFLIGSIQQNRQQIEEALRTYNWVISHHQGSEWAAKAYEQSALIQDRLRNPTGAQALRQSLFKEYPASPTTQRVCVAVADTLYEQQKFAQASALYQKFAGKLDDAAKTRFQLANAIATSGGNTSALLSVANQVLEDDKPKMAQRLYKLILEGNPPQATKDEARVRLGWCLYPGWQRELRPGRRALATGQPGERSQREMADRGGMAPRPVGIGAAGRLEKSGSTL